MKFKFHSPEVTVTKKERLLAFFKDGNKGTMQQLAKALNTSADGVRSFVNILRTEGHPIFNEVIPGTNQTYYFLAKPSMKRKHVNNKVRITMDVPRGKHVLVIE